MRLMRTMAYLVRTEGNLPGVGIKFMDDNDVVHEIAIEAKEARHLSHMLLALSSEADTQEAYITALRARKEDEADIMTIVGDAAELLVHKRSRPM